MAEREKYEVDWDAEAPELEEANLEAGEGSSWPWFEILALAGVGLAVYFVVRKPAVQPGDANARSRSLPEVR